MTPALQTQTLSFTLSRLWPFGRLAKPMTVDRQAIKTGIANSTYVIVNWLVFAASIFIPSKKTNGKKLLIIRADEIGDYILFRNCLEAIKTSHKFERYQVTLLANCLYRDLAIQLDAGWVDEFMFFDKRKFLYNPLYRFAFLVKLRRENYEVVLNSVFSRGIYLDDNFANVCRAKYRIAWDGNTVNATNRQLQRSSAYYSAIVTSEPGMADMFEFERNRRFTEVVINEKIGGSYPVISPAKVKAEWLPKGKYVVLFHGASKESKCWPCENFAELARHLYRQYGLTPVLAGGAGDVTLAGKIMAAAGGDFVLDYTGRTSLVELLDLIAGAEFTVSNDSCAYHFAGAMGKKVLAICNGSSLGRFVTKGGHGYLHCRAIYPKQLHLQAAGSIDQVTIDQAKHAIKGWVSLPKKNHKRTEPAIFQRKRVSVPN